MFQTFLILVWKLPKLTGHTKVCSIVEQNGKPNFSQHLLHSCIYNFYCIHTYVRASIYICISRCMHIIQRSYTQNLIARNVMKTTYYLWMRMSRMSEGGQTLSRHEWLHEWLHETRTLPKQFVWCSPRTKHQPVTAESHSAYIYIYVHIHVHTYMYIYMMVQTCLSRKRHSARLA